jgi:dihydrofolate reductase
MPTVTRPAICFVVARADNGVIGRDNALPWHLPADLRHFKRLTVGKPVVMGRRTFDSIGKPLPGRHNIVLTRDPDWRAEGVTVVPNLAEAIAAAGLDPKTRAEEVMIIGGAAVYAEALPIATRIYLTEVHAAPEGDTVLPPFEPARWRETAREDHPAEEGQPAYSFVTLERV